MNLESPLFILPIIFGTVLLIGGLIQRIFPPKHINPLYGYRTKRSMENEINWKFAQIYSTKIMLFFALGFYSISFIGLFLNVNYILASIISLGLMFIFCVTIFVLVEKDLKKKNCLKNKI